MAKSGRGYTMRARAESVERTRQRILDAPVELATELPFAAITLAAIAERAGVTVQTVLRQFGSRDELIDAAVARATVEETARRRTVPGDIDDALRVLIDRYEVVGDRMMILLGQERWEPIVRTITDHGRAVHRDWLEQVFATHLAARDTRAREDLLDRLIVATDLYTWQLLRRDRGRSRDRTQQQMRRLVDAVLAEEQP